MLRSSVRLCVFCTAAEETALRLPLHAMSHAMCMHMPLVTAWAVFGAPVCVESWACDQMQDMAAPMLALSGWGWPCSSCMLRIVPVLALVHVKGLA